MCQFLSLDAKRNNFLSVKCLLTIIFYEINHFKYVFQNIPQKYSKLKPLLLFHRGHC